MTPGTKSWGAGYRSQTKPPPLLIAWLGLACCLLFMVGGAHGAGWSEWSMFASPCNKTCGGGQQVRIRSCSNPAPDPNNPSDTCPGSGIQVSDCNVEACQTGWSSWTACSQNCTWGTQRRWTLCGGTNDTANKCNGSQYQEQYTKCIRYNETNAGPKPCANPCTLFNVHCPDYGICEQVPDPYEPKYQCICTLGYVMNDLGDACIKPPPPEPTPRPIPTLPPNQKQIKLVITKTASTVLLVCVMTCLLIFLCMRVFTTDRVIHMNMEISLCLAHIMLLFPPDTFEDVILCKVVSILLHFFFTTCFAFMFLEALHMYSLVAFVVKSDGMLTKTQNILVGWGLSAFVVMMTMCFSFDLYGGAYHCWLQLDRAGVTLGQFVPIVTLCLLTFVLIEAAGTADEYKRIQQNKVHVFSAKISQRTNLFIMPLIFASWVIGVMSEYEQNLALYGSFTAINAAIGVLVLLCHLMANQNMREKISRCCFMWSERRSRGRSRRRYK